MSDKAIDLKNLTLNRVLVVLTALGLIGTAAFGTWAVARGYVGLPEKQALAEKNIEQLKDVVAPLPDRMKRMEAALEQQAKDNKEEHDAVLQMRSSLQAIEKSTDETRADLKLIRDRSVLMLK